MFTVMLLFFLLLVFSSTTSTSLASLTLLAPLNDGEGDDEEESTLIFSYLSKLTFWARAAPRKSASAQEAPPLKSNASHIHVADGRCRT